MTPRSFPPEAHNSVIIVHIHGSSVGPHTLPPV
ncbi:hypothetical protein RSAG8_00267, partial [Rhizoctonia solani AG-8 WAC10335]